MHLKNMLKSQTSGTVGYCDGKFFIVDIFKGNFHFLALVSMR